MLELKYEYFPATWPGRIKLLELFFAFFCLVCAAPAYWDTQHWFLFVVGVRQEAVRDNEGEEEEQARGKRRGTGEEGQLFQKSNRTEKSKGASDGLLLRWLFKVFQNCKVLRHRGTSSWSGIFTT